MKKNHKKNKFPQKKISIETKLFIVKNVCQKKINRRFLFIKKIFFLEKKNLIKEIFIENEF